MVTPSGQRSSEPVPRSSTSGSAPSSAAMVVIMIGRKRSRHASSIAAAGASAARALGLDGEVHHHDGVLLHDAHQQHDADQRHQRQVGAAQHQRQQRADAGRGQRGQDRDRVDQAFVEHAEHDVDHHDRRQDQPRLGGERALELRRVARHSCRRSSAAGRCRCSAAATASHRVAQRCAGRQIEAQRHRRELRLMRDRPAARSSCSMRGDRRQRHLRAVRSPGTRSRLQQHVRVAPASAGSASSTTRYWLAWPKMVRDLPLAERVVQHVLHRLHRHAEPHRGVAVDHDVGAEPVVLLVGGDVAQLRQRPQRAPADFGAQSRQFGRRRCRSACTGTACG